MPSSFPFPPSSSSFFLDLFEPLIADRDNPPNDDDNANNHLNGDPDDWLTADESVAPQGEPPSGGGPPSESSSQANVESQTQPSGSVHSASTSSFSGPGTSSVGAPQVVPVGVSQSTSTSAGATANNQPPMQASATTATATAATAPTAIQPQSARNPFHPHAGGSQSLWVQEAQVHNSSPRWGCVHCQVSYSRPKTLADHHDTQHAEHRYCPFSCCVNNPHLPTPRGLSQSLTAAYHDAMHRSHLLPYVLVHRGQYYS